jgi:hypothetical protein
VDRSDTLSVSLDERGDAQAQLRLEWLNRAGDAGEPYETLRAYSISDEGWYGSYLRVLTPEGSELRSTRGQASTRIKRAERVGTDAGRNVFGNDLLMPPGPSKLMYRYRVPGAAVETEDGWLYQLVVQKQPGARPVPLAVSVDLPEGAVISEVSDGAVVEGSQVRFETDLASDVELRVAYDVPR